MKNIISTFIAIAYCTCMYAQNATCPDPGATQKRVASSFHSTVMIDYNGDVKYWGDGANPLAPTGVTYVLSPAILSPSLYAGSPVAVAAGSIGSGSDTTYVHQLYLLTTQGLYGWGATNGTITSVSSGKTPFISMALPTGVAASNINFIAASGGGIAIVTKIVGSTGGSVYIKNGNAAGGGSAYTYGDSTTVMNKSWHMVTTLTGKLKGVVRLSYSQKAVMAQTSAGKVYAWGEQVWTGSPVTVANQSAAQEVLLPVTGQETIVPADINVISKVYSPDDDQYATQFILGTNGKLYAIGEGNSGILGQGDTTDATNWVTVKGQAGGTSELTGIVQISSNNPYVYSAANYSIGALNANGQLYLWGQNSSDIIGGTTDYYPLPRIPPNFSINDARIGYFHMGGHTTIAFLRGSNRFCYIGHLIRGSMGDGTNGSALKPAYDCINTPDAYICPPPPSLGCASPSSNDLVASSAHATLVINGQPSVTYWGQASSSAEPGINVISPRILYEYNGTPIGVAASGVNDTTGASQMWILTSEGVWGWGYSANTINDGLAGTVGLTIVSLPVPVSSVSFIRSSRGGIALVCTDGSVWIKAGAGSACSANAYGDGTTLLNSNWHKVTKTNGTDLTGVSELSFGGTTAIAVTPAGVYIWGSRTYLGNGSAMANRNRAALMTLHADFTGTIIPKSAEIIQSGANGAAEFLLGSNGKVYSIGADLNGVLGQGGSGELKVMTPISLIASVRKLSSNNPFANGFYSIGALTLNGTLFLWGSNNNGMLGGAGAASFNVPTNPSGISAGSVAGFEIGGHQAIVFPKSSNQFYFAGHSIGGSKGDSSADANITAFTPGAEVTNCAGVVYSISGYMYNDANGLRNGLVDGTGLNTVSTLPVYVNLLDASSYVVGTTTVDASTGAYTFTGFPSGNYTVQVSTISGSLFSPAPASSIPSGWTFVGDQLGSAANTGIDSMPDGRLAIALTGTVTDARIGLNRSPTAANVTNGYTIIAPVGSNTFVIPVLNGSDPEDQPAAASLNGKTVYINAIPTNGKLYYNGVLLTSGILIAGYDSSKLTLDPDKNAGVVTFSYQYADGAGVKSPAANVTLNLSYVSVSGSIASDANGLNDAGGGLINGTPLSVIGSAPLYMSLVDPADTSAVLATVAVQSGGTYSFNGIVPAGTLQVVLHTTPGTLSSGGSRIPSLPDGWAFSGEQSGTVSNAGLLLPVNGIAEITITANGLPVINFGVDQKPVSDLKSYTILQPVPGQTIILNGSLPGTAPPDQLTGSDPEDASGVQGLNGNTNNRTVLIKTIPAQGRLNYNGSLVSAGQLINNYNKNLLSLILTGTGYTNTTFTYAFMDAAAVPSDVVSYVVSWNNTLPVTFASFSVFAAGNKARLEWSTASEQHNSGFNVERSYDGSNWLTIGFVATQATGGAGTAKLNYTYDDDAPLTGINYYRLKQMDIDHHYQYSNIKNLLSGSGEKVMVTPNPATDHVTVSGLSTGKMLRLTDATGHLLKQKTVTHETEIIELRGLPPGLYILQVTDHNKIIESIKLMRK